MYKICQKKHKKYLILLVVVVSFSINSQIRNVSANSTPTDLVMERIIVENERGSEIIYWNLLGYVWNSGDYLYNEPTHISLRYFYGFDYYSGSSPNAYYLYNAVTGLNDSGIAGGEMDYVDPNDEGLPVVRYDPPYDSCLYFSFLVSKDLVLIDPTYEPTHDDMEIRCHTYSASGFQPNLMESNYPVENIDITYQLRPVISFNSTHYNYENTRLEFTTDGTNWYESSYENLVLDHHDYMLKIYDIESNALIYEDTDYVRFTVNREITIDSLKLINNADEPVIFEIQDSFPVYENVSYWENIDTITMVEGTKNGTDYSVLNETDNKALKFNPNVTTVQSGSQQSSNREPNSEITVNYNWQTNFGTSQIAFVTSDNSDSTYARTQYHNYVELVIEDLSLDEHDIITDIDVRIRGYEESATFETKCSIYINGSYTPEQSIGLTLSIANHDLNFDITDCTGDNFNGLQVKIRETTTALPFWVKIHEIDVWANYYTVTEDNQTLNATIQLDYTPLPSDEDNIYSAQVNYSLYQNASQSVNISIYNYDTPAFELLGTYSDSILTMYQKTVNKSHFQNSTDNLLFQIDAFNDTDWGDHFEVIFDLFLVNITSIKNDSNILYYSPNTTLISKLVNPYTFSLTNFSLGTNYFVYISDIYANYLENTTFDFNTTEELNYTSPNTRTCLISFSDLSNQYLDFFNYKVKINGSLIYEQYFYREINTTVNISIYDRFDAYLTSKSHTVTREDNFVSIYLPVYNLIIFSNYTTGIKLKIKRNDIASSPVFEQTLPGQTGLTFQFLANKEYLIQIYDPNGTILEEKTILLNKSGYFVSFGYYETEIGTDVSIEAIELVDFIVITVIILGTIVFVYDSTKKAKQQQYTQYRKSKESKSKSKQPEVSKFWGA